MSRNTHNRQLDHHANDLDSNIELDGATTTYADAADLHTVIDDMDDRIIAAGGGGGVTVQDEGTPLSTVASTLNFTGTGVTATGSGATKTIDIPGGGGTSYLLEPVFAATVGSNITISTALNNGDTLDAVSLFTGARVLVKDQSDSTQNGIYIVGPSPARSTDWSTTSDPYGKSVMVFAGAINHETLWLSQASAGEVIGTDDTLFDQITSRKSSGSATIASGTTAIAVTHDVFFTPSAQDIMVIPTNNPTNAPGNFWISSIGATQFTINVRNDPGTSGAIFAWRVDR